MFAGCLCRMLFCRISAQNEVKLAPAELAFLAREGDMTHTMVVLGFDLFHRAVKRGESEGLSLLPYEQRLWVKAKEFLKDKARDEVDKLAPLPKSSNPLEIIAKLSGSYRLLMGKVRLVVRQILQDPRQIRGYFSPAALGRFVTDVLSAGYKDLVSSEIAASLTAQGYLISKKRQDELSSWLLIIACAGFAVFANIAWSLIPDLGSFLIVMAMAITNAVLLKLAFSILSILPLYEEVTLVLKHVSLKNFAVRFCRALSLIIRSLLVTLIVLFVLLFFSVDFMILLLYNSQSAVSLLFDVVLLTVNCFVLLSILLTVYRLKLSPTLSSAGAEVVSRHRKAFADTNIIESFKAFLNSPTYDAKVSELLAVYGYETLWLLI